MHEWGVVLDLRWVVHGLFEIKQRISLANECWNTKVPYQLVSHSVGRWSDSNEQSNEEAFVLSSSLYQMGCLCVQVNVLLSLLHSLFPISGLCKRKTQLNMSRPDGQTGCVILPAQIVTIDTTTASFPRKVSSIWAKNPQFIRPHTPSIPLYFLSLPFFNLENVWYRRVPPSRFSFVCLRESMFCGCEARSKWGLDSVKLQIAEPTFWYLVPSQRSTSRALRLCAFCEGRSNQIATRFAAED